MISVKSALDSRVNDLFAVRSRDLTPPSASHVARVLFAPVSSDSEVSSLCASVLSTTEQRRAERFTSEDNRANFNQRRAFRRYCGVTALGSAQPLSQISFKETDNGRPYLSDLPGCWFSFSACRFGFLGAWSTTHGIGVDLEDQTRKLDAVELAHQFFSDAEASVVERVGGLERLQTFYQYWSLKEAALKSIGEGLPFGLDAFEFELDPGPRIVNAPSDHGGPTQFAAHLIKGTEHCAALVTRDLG